MEKGAQVLIFILPSSWKVETVRILILVCKLRSRSMPVAPVGESFPHVDRVWQECSIWAFPKLPYSTKSWPPLTVTGITLPCTALKVKHTIVLRHKAEPVFSGPAQPLRACPCT